MAWEKWHSKRPQPPPILSRMDFWGSKIHVFVPFSVEVPSLDDNLELVCYNGLRAGMGSTSTDEEVSVSNNYPRNVVLDLPPDIRFQVHRNIFESCTTMEELRQYAGWAQTSMKMQGYFQYMLHVWATLM